jgi:hypothetical protein
VSTSTIAPQTPEHPDSLVRMLGCPLAYVFAHHAHLQSRAWSLPSDDDQELAVLRAVVTTSLAHKPTSEAEARALAATACDDVMHQAGASLRLPAGWRDRAVRSAGQLLHHVERAGLHVLDVQTPRAQPPAQPMLAATPDVVLGMPLVVVELSSSRDHQKVRELESGTAVALAQQAWLVGVAAGGAAGAFPAVASWQLQSGRLLTTEVASVAGAELVRGPTARQTFKAAREATQHAFRQLAAGDVEASGVDDDRTARADFSVVPPCSSAPCSTTCSLWRLSA